MQKWVSIVEKIGPTRPNQTRGIFLEQVKYDWKWTPWCHIIVYAYWVVVSKAMPYLQAMLVSSLTINLRVADAMWIAIVDLMFVYLNSEYCIRVVRLRVMRILSYANYLPNSWHALFKQVMDVSIKPNTYTSYLILNECSHTFLWHNTHGWILHTMAIWDFWHLPSTATDWCQLMYTDVNWYFVLVYIEWVLRSV